jgi:hypothetical protein
MQLLIHHTVIKALSCLVSALVIVISFSDFTLSISSWLGLGLVHIGGLTYRLTFTPSVAQMTASIDSKQPLRIAILASVIAFLIMVNVALHRMRRGVTDMIIQNNGQLRDALKTKNAVLRAAAASLSDRSVAALM